jgi:cytochrome b pre-mRNA-processing protein 3
MISKPGSAQEAAPPGSMESMSPLKQSVMKGIARVMGYNTRTATAIRATSDYYDRCSERDEKEATFFYDGTPNALLVCV